MGNLIFDAHTYPPPPTLLGDRGAGAGGRGYVFDLCVIFTQEKLIEGHGMNGQWLGRATGTNPGTILVNIDDCEDHFEGYVYLSDETPNLPGVAAQLITQGKSQEFRLTLPRSQFFVIDKVTGFALLPEQYSERYPNAVWPTQISIEGRWDDKTLWLSWQTDVNTHGFAKLSRRPIEDPSTLKAPVKDWGQLKRYLGRLEQRRFIYRGQNQPWKLVTAFHRTGRADLVRFLREDVGTLHRNLSARTRHIFQLQDGDQNGAFLNLIQHHGYPTPLLDWTYSPYVAVFFAFRGITSSAAEKESSKKCVRIFIFDKMEWTKDFLQINQLNIPSPHFSIFEFMAINNERVIPQQGVSTVTNVYDIENYIKTCETSRKKNYLKAIDVPIKERDKIMRDLSMMGITAGSLFPGLDGACEEIKERHFRI